MTASIAPESLPLPSARGLVLHHGHARFVAIALSLLLIVAANHAVRHYLEATPLPAYPIFPDDRVPVTWRLLLPFDIGAAANAYHAPGSYHWFTTGLTVVRLLEEVFLPNTVYYGLNALLIVASFVCTWSMFRSLVFSYTVTLAFAFGTQFYWVYVCSTLTAFYLYVIYLEANLLCLWKVLCTGGRAWRAGYAATLVLVALNHEQWLDYLAFLALACPFVWLYARRAAPALKPRVLFVAGCTALVAAAYLAVRLQYGQQQSRPGDESEMIFTYDRPVLAVEDWLSNILSYLYITVSNYFPPCLVGSNSLYGLGREGVVAAQNGYHAPQSYLVAMHHVFYWYFFAGIVFAVFVYFSVRNVRAALQRGSARHAQLAACMLMVASGFAIHSLVKYRPYLSVPLLTYKCMTGNVGMAYLVAYCLRYARTSMPLPRLYPALVMLVWGIIVYGGLARPAYLSHLSQQVGLGSLPDPLRWLSPPGPTP